MVHLTIRENSEASGGKTAPVGCGWFGTYIYTTNGVEAVHSQFQKLTKTKGGFANENSLLKLLYAGILKASERWTHPTQNENLMLSQLTPL